MDKYLSVIELANRYGIARCTLWRWVREGRFPAPVRLGRRCTRWREADIASYEKSMEMAAVREDQE
ncbi:helix-turn-helix transcriptional regulator [Halomonas kashgarensis]|uniref:helix-turn-helix transcriptional regulator n=1 Tax=Halomonas kashgarensis TaxID=3084920 RepID=UPI003A9301B1